MKLSSESTVSFTSWEELLEACSPYLEDLPSFRPAEDTILSKIDSKVC